MEYKDVLLEIGQFGPWQRRLIMILWLPILVVGAAFMNYSFALGTPEKYRCLIPACDDSSSPELKTTWTGRYIPSGEDGNVLRSMCEYRPALDPDCSPFDGQSETLQWNETQKCDQWVYDHTSYEETAVTRFGLVCERNHMKSLVGVAQIFVFGISGVLTGYVSDTFGRKKVILLSTLGCTTFLIVSSFAPTYWMYFAAYMCAALFINGIYYGPYVLSVEIVGQNYTALVGQIINMPFVLGELWLIGVAYFFRKYQQMIWVAFIPAYITLIIEFLVPESPRWLFVNGKSEEAERVIIKGAKANKKELSPALQEGLKMVSLNMNTKSKSTDNMDVHYWHLWKNPCMRKRLIIMSVNFIAVVLCYNGITLNTANLGGSLHFNMAAGVIIEIPSYLFCIYGLNKFGRRPMLVWTQLLTSVCAFLAAVAIATNIDHTIVIILNTTAKFATAAAFAVVVQQCVELFPTSVRNTALGSCSLTSRIGGILSPVLSNLGPGYELVPLIAFGVSSFIAGITAIFIAETSHRELPENIEEAEETDDSLEWSDGLNPIKLWKKSIQK